MMDSSTHCYKKTIDSLSEQGRQRRALALGALLGGCGLWKMVNTRVHAQDLQEGDSADAGPWPNASDTPDLKLQRDGDALLLSAQLDWVLPMLVQDALLKGIPVHFVAEASMLRERWYWSDEKLLQAERFLRLSYQPLTRRWRLYAGSQPFEGKGFGAALSRSFDTLEEAVQAMQRIVRWRIGDASALPESGQAWLQLRFRIDLSQFPRPLQIGVLGRADWNLLVTQRERVDLGHLQ